jgi:molybdopterin-containing oxidoreductase family molybdopterin binding subunit
MIQKEKEDVWIPTVCEMCLGNCGILVHRVNGEVVGIRGNPDNQTSLGRICSKAFSSLLMLKDPNRVNTPLKRTNPIKGIGIDPEWVEITWDEALNVIVQRLKQIRSEDPRKLLYTCNNTALEASDVLVAFGKAFGSPNLFTGGSGPCGDAQHLSACQRYACVSVHPDYNYCNYFLNFGCGEGVGTYFVPTGMAQRFADARIKGMKTVVIDPVFSTAAAKADEWIPIRPGTDALFALAMLNVLLNELRICDIAHIKTWTNGPYLVNEEGYYIRDGETQKPLVWDPKDRKGKTFDDPTIRDYALEGEYSFEGVDGKPAFSLLREHLKKYTPEQASEITTVPAKTIRRIATEFGKAAAIGSTVEIDGYILPHRPVATAYYKGPETHLNGFANCTAIELLTEVVGARGVPGGVVGTARCLGYPETALPYYTPRVSLDGFLKNEV